MYEENIVHTMENAGLYNIEEFKKWVNESAAGSSEESGTNGFTDADCRMTVMLLAGEAIDYESVNKILNERRDISFDYLKNILAK
mgnify:CR=1 FL=1